MSNLITGLAEMVGGGRMQVLGVDGRLDETRSLLLMGHHTDLLTRTRPSLRFRVLL